MALYASYVYGLFYLIITNISEAFYLTRGWSGTVGTLPNVSLLIGVIIGSLGNMLWSMKYAKLVRDNGGHAIPEQRFPNMMAFSWFMPMGIFIFSWTCRSDIHWIVPCIGIAFTGTGFITIFQGCINYLVDMLPQYSASAIACNTFGRSIFAAAFPLFAKQLFVNLGVHWGGSVIGFIALGMIPIPFYFFKFGKRIREKSIFVH
ncbi:unnamed protein product [Ambrosiozyma monospora]|uniref:Unnamed protein product n=1 Tax=Ambrosiozyma monospora TaxID=43982 RepID=A0ACB5UC18_AMBMO|nr:unnamed protein product [Ambrosiozyma monospora]